MAGNKKTSTKKATSSGTRRSAADMAVMNFRCGRTVEQRKIQENELGSSKAEHLRDRRVISRWYLDVEVFKFGKLLGIEDLFFQDYENVFNMARREVYIPIIQEFFDHAEIVNNEEIKTRFNNQIITVTAQDVAKVLKITLKSGEQYSDDSESKCPDANCIWKDTSESICSEVNNLVDACHFNHVVVSKVVLPKGSARNYVIGHARYALYKIVKRTKINPAHLIWDYLIKFLEKQQGNLPFGSLISSILDQKGLLVPYLQIVQLLEKFHIESTPIKLGDVEKIKIEVDNSEVSENLLRKKKKKKETRVSEGKGKEKIGESSANIHTPAPRKRDSVFRAQTVATRTRSRRLK